ncbi:GNAT family N-acetyltransferase [Nocardiopsis dassonvillei]
MSPRIDTASRADIAACARIIARALHRDPVVRDIVPGEEDRIERLTLLYTAELRSGPARTGAIDVARSEDGAILGVAAWEGPRRPGLGDRWQRLRALPLQVRAIGVRHLGATLSTLSHFEAARPRARHWYLADIAVDDRARGLGIGSALLTHRLAAIDRQGLPAHLEATTPESRRLYERFGFQETGRLDIPSRPAAMTRPPAAPPRGGTADSRPGI